MSATAPPLHAQGPAHLWCCEAGQEKCWLNRGLCYVPCSDTQRHDTSGPVLTGILAWKCQETNL
jgi:hypothetical protein